MRHPNLNQCLGINPFTNYYPWEGSNFMPRYGLSDKISIIRQQSMTWIEGVKNNFKEKKSKDVSTQHLSLGKGKKMQDAKKALEGSSILTHLVLNMNRLRLIAFNIFFPFFFLFLCWWRNLCPFLALFSPFKKICLSSWERERER